MHSACASCVSSVVLELDDVLSRYVDDKFNESINCDGAKFLIDNEEEEEEGEVKITHRNDKLYLRR